MTTANITKKAIKVSNIIANNKETDGNNDATLDLSQVVLEGMVSGDDLSITASASFSDALVGKNKEVTISNLTLVGNDKDNYYLSSESQTIAYANITLLLMNAEVLDYTGIYDKESHSITITNTLDDVVISYSSEENGTYSSDEISYTNAGTYTVYYKIEKGNYETINGSATITINKKEVKVSNITASDKEYDGSTLAIADTTKVVYAGIISGDNLGINVLANFNNKNAGENKNVILSNLELTGNDASNYILSSDSQNSAKASILKKKVVISNILAETKEYDGTTEVTLNYSEAKIEGLVSGDNLTIKANASFADDKVGVDKDVTISNLELEGDSSSNYEIEYEISQHQAKADIVKKESKSNTGLVVALVIVSVLVVLGAGAGTTVLVLKKKKA